MYFLEIVVVRLVIKIGFCASYYIVYVVFYNFQL